MSTALKLEPAAIREAIAALDLCTEAFIDGRFASAASGRTFTSRNPATGEALIQVAECGPEDVDRAVIAARRKADGGSWSRLSPGDRKRVLIRFADLVAEHVDELALTESLDAGKPISDTLTLDIPGTADCIRWHAEAIDKVYDQVAPTGRDSLAMVIREPVGVVGAVIPRRHPGRHSRRRPGSQLLPAPRRLKRTAATAQLVMLASRPVLGADCRWAAVGVV